MIKKVRGCRRLAEIARAARCSIGLLSELETGRRHRISPRLAGRIEEALGVRRGALFYLEPEVAELLAPYQRAPAPQRAA